MARCHRLAAALIALPALGSTVVAQSPEPALPRVIYGQTEPQVFYGPSSAPPEAPPPRVAAPQAAAPPPPPQSSGTSLEYGWVPAGPPVWFPPPAWNRPLPPVGRIRPTPNIDNRFERPLPAGRYLGAPSGVSSPPFEPRRGLDRR